MKHAIHKVRSFRIVRAFTLEIVYDDGRTNTIDFGPILRGPMYGPLKNPSIFNSVRIDSEVHTLVWPNGADFDPEVLYNWDHYASELKDRAKGWQAAE